jgi:hypothetical protein
MLQPVIPEPDFEASEKTEIDITVSIMTVN